MTGPATARSRLVPRALRRRTRRLRARSRLRAANLRGTGAALRRRAQAPAPAVAVAEATGVETTYGAPRTLLGVTVKRDNPQWLDLYGHWWVEAGERSWGWWPREIPVGVRQLARGTDGVLNGTGLVGRRGTWQRDPQHGRRAAHCFHPVLVEPISDEEVVARLQAHADGYCGEWRWTWTRRSVHATCRTFQDGLLAAAGLTETLQDLPSRGSGCPFLYPPRTVLWRAQDLLDAARGWLVPRASPDGVAEGRSAQVLSAYERVAGRCDRYWRTR